MSARPTLHLVGIFHTIHSAAFSHCAFTGKALRFPKMMQDEGWRVIEYSNGRSESACEEKVVILDSAEFEELRGTPDPKEFHSNGCQIGNAIHRAFSHRLFSTMLERVEPGDIICHPFGPAHESLLQLFPDNPHVEIGIGYPQTMQGTFKIFESQAWRHTHIERDKRLASNYEWVIPNYFDLTEWEPRYEPGSYIAFLGRICKVKGMDTVFEIAKRTNLPVHVAGQGDITPWKHPNIAYRGPLAGKERSDFLRHAVCTLMPTEYVEPFGGSGIEGMLCGTPLISTDFGAFTETVANEINGFRCKTLRQWLDAIDACKRGWVNREHVADMARSRYSLETVGRQYTEAFEMIADMPHRDWYKDC